VRQYGGDSNIFKKEVSTITPVIPENSRYIVIKCQQSHPLVKKTTVTLTLIVKTTTVLDFSMSITTTVLVSDVFLIIFGVKIAVC
jgi:hypothetical protein